MVSLKNLILLLPILVTIAFAEDGVWVYVVPVKY